VAYWKYELRDQLGLGNILASPYFMPEGLTKKGILKEFTKYYTSEWVLNCAMEDHNQKISKCPALQIGPIFDLLTSRFKNFTDFREDLLDDDFIYLRREGMALFLQECEIFELIS
jgi:hypothetical protein